MLQRPPRIALGSSLKISRILTGLWQVADIERTKGMIDPDEGAGWLSAYTDQGFDTFDMADHYGSAEIIAGRHVATSANRPQVFTKWCPPPGPMTADIVRAGVQERLDRLGTERIDLLQFHW